MRSALLDCSTISAMRAWSITSAPAKPWTSGRLTTSRRAASESASWKLTRSPEVDVRVLSELELEPPEHSAASALAEASDLGVAHKYHRQEVRRQLGPLVGAEQRAEGLVDQGQLEIAGERRVVVDLHDQAVAGRGVADAGEVRLLGRNL